MAICGLGSYDEPIVVSDDEDELHVENELSRGSPQRYSAFEAARAPAASSSQKRKRQEIDMTQGNNTPHGLPENPAKRARKKQKLRKDSVRPPQSTPIAPSYVTHHDPAPDHLWTSARFDISPGPSSASTRLAWKLPTDLGRLRLRLWLTPAPRDGLLRWPVTPMVLSQTPAKLVSTTLDESLRRLEALSASLLAASAPPPPPSLAPTTAKPSTTSPLVDSKKRRIGKIDDRSNAGSFSLTTPTLLPSSSSAVSSRPPSPANSVVLAHIPKKFRNRQFVTTWANRFGVVSRLEVDSKSGKALVEYEGTEQADAAFTSFKLRGDGKEHIRVYRYNGSAPARVMPASTAHSDMEEGEIEEGEVLEVQVPPPPAPTKAKKQKKKVKKSLPLEQRFTDAASPAPPPQHQEEEPSLVISEVDPTPAVPSSGSSWRPALEDRFSDAPIASGGVWEEEMELDSEDDRRPDSPALLATPIVDIPYNTTVGKLKADMDVDILSAVPDSSASLPAPSPPRPEACLRTPLRPHAVSDVEARREVLEAPSLKTMSQLAAPPSASATSTISGTSAIPEPATPRDLSVGADVSIVVAGSSDAGTATATEEFAAPVEAAKPPAVSLEDLAVSFIAESIQAVVASPASLPKPPPRTLVPSQPFAPPSPPVSSAPSTSQLTGAAQILAKQKRLEEHLAASKELLAKISTAKTKAEKMHLMRLFKERQRIMDSELKGSLTPPSTPGPRVASTATPNPLPKATSMPTSFRWPETAPVLIIDISDDETD
ncbi:hypothetical protein BV20DRAFT_1039815 [Pilatotrama ljubarskyi]|nr:hypothetical protein BV20DRAFT_1039815 [Pilatotrama ljubarskyi]